MTDFSGLLSEASRLPTEEHSWGTLQWLCNDSVSPGARQTLGRCLIRVGGRNPRHLHPNCEEVLTVLSGRGRHWLDSSSVELGPGMTLRIPVGVPHQFENIGDEPLACLITFDTGRRETILLDDAPLPAPTSE